jgi:seryl-tRNA synthetase
MPSRFVPGGTVDEPIERDEEWLKAQEELESLRRQREEQNQQAGGKSLYEVLQQNKGELPRNQAAPHLEGPLRWLT